MAQSSSQPHKTFAEDSCKAGAPLLIISQIIKKDHLFIPINKPFGKRLGIPSYVIRWFAYQGCPTPNLFLKEPGHSVANRPINAVNMENTKVILGVIFSSFPRVELWMTNAKREGIYSQFIGITGNTTAPESM